MTTLCSTTKLLGKMRLRRMSAARMTLARMKATTGTLCKMRLIRITLGRMKLSRITLCRTTTIGKIAIRRTTQDLEE
jgi:hypothetical protein